MIQFKILTGKMAGTTWVARHFPVRVGRSSTCDLQVDEHGIWDEHFRVEIDPREGFVLEGHPHALVSVNGPLEQRHVLHNGDLIEVGALKMQFWLGDATQRGLRIREALVWASAAAVTLGQLALIYWLVSTN